MSVPMIENWALVQGLVKAVLESQDLSGFNQVEILVENVEPVDGYPNLIEVYLEEEKEPTLPVLMPNDLVIECEITTGVVVECRVRRAGLNRIFVNRDHVNVQKPTS